MKKIIMVIVLLSIQSFSFVHADVTSEVKDYLKQGKLTSFRFKENSIGTVANLIQHVKGIKVLIDKNIDTTQSFPINLRDQNFLVYLDVTTKKLGLKYEILDSKTIRVYQ
ncbi:hypothetical protein A7P53_11605 [Acinetobacter defluvii]|uniref:hypothetical protein n=1 Tax=Acinetobacter defluvii TaxID=1871111 RepID=UPI00148FD187|nr:hypothetical protein [Acinetobacter defluvii]NNP73211.1 hypothetical protein [Acinetobacter defluvii]